MEPRPRLCLDLEVAGVAHDRVHGHGRAQRLVAARSPVDDDFVAVLVGRELGNDVLGLTACGNPYVEARLVSTAHLEQDAIAAAPTAPPVTQRSRSWFFGVAAATA